MRCPRCARDGFQPSAACAECGFTGPPGLLEELGHIAYLLGEVDAWGQVEPGTRDLIRKRYLARQEQMEIEAGLCPRPAEPLPVPAEVPARPAKPPREPITFDGIWQTLLSERTLKLLLFLGAFLLVASATTYIVHNWETLPPVVQLGFIVLFALSFYGAGWFLRTRMKLHLSGIAVTAVGSLLVPLDFYTVGWLVHPAGRRWLPGR